MIRKVLLVIPLAGCWFGCSPQTVPLPSKDALSLALTALAFDNQITCEDLRNLFDIEYLQPVETPDQIGLDFEQLWLPTVDGNFIRVWRLPTQLDRGLVVLSGGSVGSMPCYLFVAKLLVDDGWSVVMSDYRGFGASSGIPDLDTLPDDLELVLDWALERTGREHATLMGISLGSIPTVAVAVRRPEAVNGVVLDSPVALGEMIKRLDFAFSSTQDVIDLLDAQLNTQRIISNLTAPVLMYSGGKDVLTPPAATELLFAGAAGPKRLVRFPELRHARGPYFATGTYTFELERFLSSVWEQSVDFTLQLSRDAGVTPGVEP